MSVLQSEYSADTTQLREGQNAKGSSNPTGPSVVRQSFAIMRANHKVAVAALAILALPLAGCSSFDALNPFGGEKYEQKILTDTPAEVLYNQGLADVNAGNPKGALKKFKELEKQYPASEWSQKALLMTTYANYQGHEFDDAVISGNRYAKLYPNSPDAAYALYMSAESQYERIPDISRDQDTAVKAMAGFNEVVQKYPKSEYASDAKYKMQVARDQLAGKEMSVGRFYLARKNYTAAINRFRNVIGEYQTTRHTEEALERLTEAYMGLGIVGEAQTAAAILGHNYPDSQWYKDAYSLLQSSGTEPRENNDSWISKAFRKVGL